MRLLVDMNLSPLWVGFLRSEGFDAVHWSTVGAPDAPDSELMIWALAHGCVVLTHDLDFGILLALTNASGPSVLQVRVADPLPSSVGADVARVLHMRSDVLASGALITVDTLKSRVRVLPFARSEDPA